MLIRRPDPHRGLSIDLAHVGYRMLPGHRIRLHLASSDFPLYLPHPGTDEDPWLAVDGLQSEQTLEVGGSLVAFLSLTVSG
jgi:predicted acyl esterase